MASQQALASLLYQALTTRFGLVVRSSTTGADAQARLNAAKGHCKDPELKRLQIRLVASAPDEVWIFKGVPRDTQVTKLGV